MRPPLPSFLPSNLTASEIIRALEPCFELPVMRALEDAFREEAQGEADASNDCLVEQSEKELREANELSKERRDMLEAMVENWQALQLPVPWNDRSRWDRASESMTACVSKTLKELL